MVMNKNYIQVCFQGLFIAGGYFYCLYTQNPQKDQKQIGKSTLGFLCILCGFQHKHMRLRGCKNSDM